MRLIRSACTGIETRNAHSHKQLFFTVHLLKLGCGATQKLRNGRDTNDYNGIVRHTPTGGAWRADESDW